MIIYTISTIVNVPTNTINNHNKEKLDRAKTQVKFFKYNIFCLFLSSILHWRQS